MVAAAVAPTWKRMRDLTDEEVEEELNELCERLRSPDGYFEIDDGDLIRFEALVVEHGKRVERFQLAS